MNALLVTIVGIVLGAVAALANLQWLTAVAALIALTGALAQYRDGLPFERVFSPTDWRQSTASHFQLMVPFCEHKKSSPAVTVYLGQPPVFEVVECDVSIDADGRVIVGAGQTFHGKIVVK